MAIDPVLIRDDAESLALLRQLFPADGSGLHRLGFGLTPAGTSTTLLMQGENPGSVALPFSAEETAFVLSVFERLAREIALQPVQSADSREPFQLASVARVQGEDSITGITYSGFTSVDERVVRDASYLLIELELADEPGLSAAEQSTIVHEIGHAIGLVHPGGDPNDPAYTDRDTIMSYNVGADQPATWFSASDLEALRSIWGAAASAAEGFRIDRLISGGWLIEAFDPAAGDRLQIDADLLSRESTRLRIVDSGRALRSAQRSRQELVFDDRSSSLYLNANGRQRGWGAEGGLLAVFDPPFALQSSDLQLV